MGQDPGSRSRHRDFIWRNKGSPKRFRAFMLYIYIYILCRLFRVVSAARSRLNKKELKTKGPISSMEEELWKQNSVTIFNYIYILNFPDAPWSLKTIARELWLRQRHHRPISENKMHVKQEMATLTVNHVWNRLILYHSYLRELLHSILTVTIFDRRHPDIP